jgi:hypothetical protein
VFLHEPLYQQLDFCPFLGSGTFEEMLMELNKRLEQLEKQNRQMRILIALMFLTMVGVVALGASSVNQVRDRIEARVFVLKDAAGKERGALRLVALNRGGGVVPTPTLTLSDTCGTAGIVLSCVDDRTGNHCDMFCNDKSGNPMVGISADEHDQESELFMVHPGSARAEIDRPSAADSRSGRVNTRLFTALAFSTHAVIDPAPVDESSQDGRYFFTGPYTHARSSCARWIRMNLNSGSSREPRSWLCT